MKTRCVPFAALLLDFDGVILESTNIKTQAFVEMFAGYPKHLDAIVAYHQKHVGMSRYQKFAWIYQELLKKPLDKIKLHGLGQHYSHLVFEKIVRTAFVPGAPQTLAACASLGVPIFVISGTPHEELNRIIDLRNIRRYITNCWGSPTEKTTAIQHIRSAYGFQPDEMLLVGDGILDYQAAKSEGVPFLARNTPEAPVDWTRRGIPSIPDLTPLANIHPHHPVMIPGNGERVPAMALNVIQTGG